MTKEEKEVLLQWIEKAEHDMIATSILLEANPAILAIACFHCQQAIEKYLKAFLIYNNQEFIFTHNLDYLVHECSAFDEDFINLDLKNLNIYAVRARYPHDYITPEYSEAKEYFEIASNVKELVLSKIQL